MSTQELSARPGKVVAAATLLYLVVLIGMIRTGMTVMRHADVRSPQFLIFTKIVIYTVSVFLIYRVSKGKNWAKWLLVLILALAFPLSVLPSFDAIVHSPAHSTLGLLQLGLYVAAMVLLFHRTSTAWLGAETVPN